MTLFRKMFVPVLLIAVLSLAATGFINYMTARNELYAVQKMLGVNLAETLQRELTLISRHLREQAELLARSPEVIQLLSGAITPPRETDLNARLRHTAKALQGVSTLAVLDAEGKVVAISSSIGKGVRCGDRRYFKEVMQGRSAQQGPLVARTAGEPGYVLAYPVMEGDKILGAVIAVVQLEYLNSNLVDPVRLKQTGHIFVLSNSGQVLMHPDRSAVFSADWLSPAELAAMKKQKSGVMEHRAPDGTPMLFSFVALSYPDWIVVAAQPMRDVMASASVIRNVTLWSFGAASATVLAFFSFALLSIIRDLRRTMHFAEAAAAGDLQAEPHIRRKDEIGVLARALSTMVGTLKKEAALSDLRAKEAERLARNLQNVLASIDGGVVKIRMDENCTVLWANDGFYALYGCNRKDFADYTGNKACPALYPEDRQAFLGAVQQSVRSDCPSRLEYRIRKKDGSLTWLSGRVKFVGNDGNHPVFQAVLIDVTEQKLAARHMALEHARFQILAHRGKDILYEYDIASDVMTYAGQFAPLFGTEAVNEHFLNILEGSRYSLPEDRERLRAIFTLQSPEHPEGNLELPFLQGERLVWYRMDYATLFDENNTAIKVIGRLENIQEQKEKEHELLAQAQMDGMTGLLNKTATEAHVQAILREEGQKRHALILVDVDNFKSANDYYGHQFGDAVLKKLARLLQQTFRGTDIIGRFGGDEFLVFARDLDDPDQLIARIELLYAELRRCIVENNANYVLSVSMGIGFYTGDGQGYEKLFNKADTALYRAKGMGKGRFVLYHALWQ